MLESSTNEGQKSRKSGFWVYIGNVFTTVPFGDDKRAVNAEN
jgi:hypothetical protein